MRYIYDEQMLTCMRSNPRWLTVSLFKNSLFDFCRRFWPYINLTSVQCFNIVGSLSDREVACSASYRKGQNLESCVWRAVSSHSSHHPQEILLAQFSKYEHKGALKPHSFHFICWAYFVDTRQNHWPIAGLMLVHRLRRWHNIKPTLF